MSINFQNPANPQSIALLDQLFGKPVAGDNKTRLYDKLETINQNDMAAVARAAGQPVNIEMNDVGQIKTMSDGTRYEVTQSGWRKLM